MPEQMVRTQRKGEHITHKIHMREYGGPEVLHYEEVPVRNPGPGEVRVKIEAAGVNFIDVYHRKGSYSGKLPLSPGVEAAGMVDVIGPEVSNVKLGDHVAYAMQLGGYAEYAFVPVWKLVPLPEGVDPQLGAAVMLQGMTAHYLYYSTYMLQPGDTALIHAAAGGVGLLLV